MASNDDPLFLSNPLGDLDDLIRRAQTMGAGRLLILAGAPPVCRIDKVLSPPLFPKPLHFNQTLALATALLDLVQLKKLDEEGSVEIDYFIGEVVARINVFFGDASHNFVVFLNDK